MIIIPELNLPHPYKALSPSKLAYNESNEVVTTGDSTTVEVAGKCYFSGSKITELTSESGIVIQIVAQMIISVDSSLDVKTKVEISGVDYLIEAITESRDMYGVLHHKTGYLSLSRSGQ